MQIKLEIDASEYNGFLNLEVFDKNKKLSVIPKFVTGYNSLNLEVSIPNTLYFNLSGKNHKRDTLIDSNTNKIIKDKSLQIIGMSIDGKPLNKNRVAKMFYLKTEENKLINSAYWGFNGSVELALNCKDSLEYHLSNQA